MQNRRVTQIAVDQLTRIRHPNLMANNYSLLEEASDDVTVPRFQRVEVIRVRRKRETVASEFPELSEVKSRLLRTYKKLQPLTDKLSSLSEHGDAPSQADKVSAETKDTRTYFNTLEKDFHKLKAKLSRTNEKSADFAKEKDATNNRNNNKQEKESKVSKSSSKTISQLSSSLRIPSWQWSFMKKTLRRDTERSQR